MHRNFLQIVSSQLVGQKTESADTRRIEIAQFLHLAVVAYHQTQRSGGGLSDGGGGGPSASSGAKDKSLADLATEGEGVPQEFYQVNE